MTLAELLPNVRELSPTDKLRLIRILAEDLGADDDWLMDSEEQLQDEDAQWEATLERRKEEFAALEAEARAEIARGVTQPMFDEHGNVIADELAHHS